jgi:hypothetical protein
MTKKITSLLFLMLSVVYVTHAQINLQNGLIAYYTFNLTLDDSTSNQFDLLSGGNPGPIADRFGIADNAYHLTGTNPDYFTGSYSATMAPSELTLAAWINLSDPFIDQKIAGKTSVGPGYLMGVDSNKVDVEIWDVTNYHMRLKAGNIIANTWTHVAISYKASGYLKIYINGLPVDSIAASSNGVGTNTSNAFCIGGAPWDNFALNLDGSVDDVCLYGRQLSDAEVAALFAIVPTGIDTKEHNTGISCYPNPMDDGLLHVVGLNNLDVNPTVISITDLMGKVVLSQQIQGVNQFTLDLSALSGGMYQLQVSSIGLPTQQQKIIIRK